MNVCRYFKYNFFYKIKKAKNFESKEFSKVLQKQQKTIGTANYKQNFEQKFL